jgi:hypothetical protein
MTCKSEKCIKIGEARSLKDTSWRYAHLQHRLEGPFPVGEGRLTDNLEPDGAI